MKAFLTIAALLTTAATSPADAPGPDFFRTLRVADTRLATIAERLTTANVALCDRRAPALGVILHGLNQYEKSSWPQARTVFGFSAPVAVEAVVAGGAGEQAGAKSNDGIRSVAGLTLPASIDGSLPGSGDRDKALAAIDAAPPGQPIALTVERDGQEIPLSVAYRTACRSHFEIVVGNGFDAQADGLHVQLGEKFFEGFTDEEIAVVVAHELAHNILHHRERLDAAKVSRGVAAEFGRNARLFRETEDQADALSVYLLANAGYDPLAPGRFWRAYANKVGIEGILRSRTHSSGKVRAAAMDSIAGSIPARLSAPVVPSLLDSRDQPL